MFKKLKVTLWSKPDNVENVDLNNKLEMTI